MVVQQEAQMLRKGGHMVTLYERHSDDIADFSLVSKAALPARVLWSLEDRHAFARVLEDSDVDVIHLHNSFPLISPSILSVARGRSIPVVMTLHNYRLVCAAGTLLRDGQSCTLCLGSTPLPAIAHKCYRNSFAATIPIAVSIGVHSALDTWSRGVNRFIVMSEFAMKTMETSGIKRDQIVIKPHFIPHPDKVRQTAGDYGLYLGRLSIEKGADLLIDAWNPENGRLLIAGDGPMRQELQDRARAHGSSIEFLGNLPREEAMELLTSARYLVNPSRAFETFGLSVVEAFAHGVPTIVPGHGVFPEIVRNGVNGIVFESGDVQSLARAIAELSDPATSEQMGVAARQDYIDRFTPEQNLVQLEQIYHAVSNGEHSPCGSRALRQWRHF
ncbi:glycosyltransferase family 4 protein [Arthrobacter alpinus]|nr:glycosyltransferase family 4 protein [Arthrobacter alpinus]